MKLWAFLQQKELSYGHNEYELKRLDTYSPEIAPDAPCHTRVFAADGGMIDRIEGYVLSGGHLYKTVSRAGEKPAPDTIRMNYSIDQYNLAEVVALKVEHIVERGSFLSRPSELTLSLLIKGLPEPVVLAPSPNRYDADSYNTFCQALISALS